MIKKIALPLLIASTVLAVANVSSARRNGAYVGIGIGFSLTDQNQGTLNFDDSTHTPINIKTKAGSLSGSGFLGVSPMKYVSLEADVEYTEVSNEIKRSDEVNQAIWGNKPITTTIITPLVNLVVRTATMHGVGLFVMAGAGGSYMRTKITHDTPSNYNYDDDAPTDTYNQFTRAYDIGVGAFYKIPDSSTSLSGGFRYINLGGKFNKHDFSLNATSKEEVFLRLKFGF